jgi:hypothetical protein
MDILVIVLYGWYWGFNSELYTYKAGTLLLKPYLHPYLSNCSGVWKFGIGMKFKENILHCFCQSLYTYVNGKYALTF